MFEFKYFVTYICNLYFSLFIFIVLYIWTEHNTVITYAYVSCCKEY